MSNQPRLLLDCLTNTPWKQLTALLAAYQLPRTAQQTKAQVIEQLHHHLLQTATITSIIAQLDGSAQAALRALLAAAGALPVHTFEHRFGLIRPYRPWRKADATGADQPWRTPISTTETLWYLGLLYRDPPKPTPGFIQHYLIPAELVPPLRAHLALDQPTPFAPPPLPHPGRNGPLDHHLAIWLATVHAGHDGQGVAPVHGRWLPPTVVALLCTRLGLDQAPTFTPIRSERHHPYLAFLHYLALAADLVAVTPTAFQLTPTAWAWLAVAAATRHRQLAAAWHNAQVDLAQPFAFRWEPLSPAARTLVMAQLTAQLAPPRLAVTTLVAQWRLLDPYAYLPGPRLAHWHDEDSLYDPLTALITGPLHWLGFISLTPDPSTPAPSTLDPSTLLVSQPSETRDQRRRDHRGQPQAQLVDEEHRRVRTRVLERLEEGPLDEVLAREQRLLAQAGALCLGNANAEELARVVPFVERLGCIDALEALEADERGVEHFGERLGRLGLADPRLALEQERLREAHGAEQRGREPRLGEVVVIGQSGDERSRVWDLLGEGGHQAFTAVEWDATNKSRQPGQQKYQVVPSISA